MKHSNFHAYFEIILKTQKIIKRVELTKFQRSFQSIIHMKANSIAHHATPKSVCPVISSKAISTN